MLKTCLAILTILGLGSLLGGLALLHFLGAENPPESDSTAPTPITLEAGTTVFDTFNEGETIIWALDGHAGDCITLDLISETDGFDPQLRLLSSDEVILLEDDDSGAWVNARIAEFTLPEDATYFIEVQGYFVFPNLTQADYELDFQPC